jgi:hypothetical protein
MLVDLQSKTDSNILNHIGTCIPSPLFFFRPAYSEHFAPRWWQSIHSSTTLSAMDYFFRMRTRMKNTHTHTWSWQNHSFGYHSFGYLHRPTIISAPCLLAFAPSLFGCSFPLFGYAFPFLSLYVGICLISMADYCSSSFSCLLLAMSHPASTFCLSVTC